MEAAFQDIVDSSDHLLNRGYMHHQFFATSFMAINLQSFIYLDDRVSVFITFISIFT